jgi:hypothetical protein
VAAACPCWFKIPHVVHAIKPSQSLILTSSNPCTPSSPSVAGSHITSMSRSFITPITTPTLSMKPLTATRSMRFVVAAYSTCSMLLSVDSEEEVRLKVRRTRGDNSASTESAACAVDARCVVGKGMDSVLRNSKRHPMICSYLAYSVQGKPSSVLICWSAMFLRVSSHPPRLCGSNFAKTWGTQTPCRFQPSAHLDPVTASYIITENEFLYAVTKQMLLYKSLDSSCFSSAILQSTK